MKKIKLLIGACILAAVSLALIFHGKDKNTVSWNKVVLTMGSWLPEDTVHMKALLAEYRKVKPRVEIRFQPSVSPDYDDILRMQLANNAGPDLLYAYSYGPGREYFLAGHFADCGEIPGITERFSPAALAPWQTPEGSIFGVPFMAVSHGVYYNRTIFQQEGLEIPQTWEDFLALCKTLSSLGYTPLANGIADEWDILESFFLGILPNFVGGAGEREKYESGEWKLNDAHFAAAFQAMADIAKYLPKDFDMVNYRNSQALFKTQQAVMFVDGSWTLGKYEAVPFEWGVFALPAPRGRKTIITFHPDAAITYNPATLHPQECQEFLAWLSSAEGSITVAKVLPPGIFPMSKLPIQPANPRANEFLTLCHDTETDVRFIWPKLIYLYSPMNQAVIQILKGTMSPRQAANAMEAAFNH